MDVLVTGGTGGLGRRLIPLLLAGGHSVRVLSRRSDAEVVPGARLVPGDLTTGRGLTAALAGVQAVAHCATNPTRQARATDVDGTGRLLEGARAAGCGHVLSISIVGIDRVPHRYYRAKLEAERMIKRSGIPQTILRATQFHELLVQLFERSRRLPFEVVPRGYRFQPVETGEVAARMAGLLDQGPKGRVLDMGGPEVRQVEDLARMWARASGRSDRPLRLPFPGRTGRAFRQGLNTCPDHPDGSVTWETFLRLRYPGAR